VCIHAAFPRGIADPITRPLLRLAFVTQRTPALKAVESVAVAAADPANKSDFAVD